MTVEAEMPEERGFNGAILVERRPNVMVKDVVVYFLWWPYMHEWRCT